MKYFVYALVRSDEFRPFYIGATGSPRQRASTHRGTYGKDILFSVIGEFDDWQGAARVETETIEFYRGRGVALANHLAYHPYAPSSRESRNREHLERIWEEAIRRGVPDPGPLLRRHCRPPPRPYPWKRLMPMSELGDIMSQLSEKLARLPSAEVEWLTGQIEPR